MSENGETGCVRSAILGGMELDFESCNRARLSRDPRFDGRLSFAYLGASPGAIDRRAEVWRPWRAYAVMYLWTYA